MRSRVGHAPASAVFWKLVLGNGAVFVAGSAVLVLSPATVSAPVMIKEIAVLVVGLTLLLAVNAVLIRSILRPLDGLAGLMERVDLLRPGERLTVPGNRDLGYLVGTFNDMLTRLETDRTTGSAQALAAQEAERHRIAQELHDEIGQSLTAVLLNLKRTVDCAPATLQDELRAAQEAIRTSLDEVRRVARRLRPGVLEDLGLLSAMRALATDFSRASEVPVVPRLDHRPPVLSTEAELVLYRVAQESLTNIARHADASRVELTLTTEQNCVVLRITDDGRGLDGSAVGAGIRGMRERALLIGARLTLDPAPEGGTEVRLVVPHQTGRE